MVAWLPAARTAMKVAPFAMQIARQLDRQVRPHVLAYRLAREIDGFVGRWTGDDGGHWVVFADRHAEPLRSFPPLPRDEHRLVGRELDRGTLRHHSELPEARVLHTTSRLTARGLPVRETADPPIDVIDVEVIEVDRDPPPR